MPSTGAARQSRLASLEVTRDGIVVAVPQAPEFPGLEPSGWIGQRLEVAMAAFVDGRSPTEWSERLERARRTPGSASYRDRTLCADPRDEPVPLETIITPVPGPDGHEPQVLVHCIRSAPAGVDEAPRDDVFHALTESDGVLVAVLGDDGAAYYVSPRWSDATGWPPPSITGRGYLDLVHSEDRGLLDPTELTDDHSFYFRLLHADGRFHLLQANIERVQRPGRSPLRWVLRAAPVDPAREDDFAREVQAQLSSALAVSRLGRFSIYFREPRVDCNERYSEILGRDAQQVMTEEGLDGLFKIVHDDDVARVKGVFEEAMHSGQAFEAEYRIWQRTSDGPVPRIVVARGRVEQDTAGPLRIIGVVDDVTDARLEDESRIKLQKREALGTLAGGIAHDFNNVVSAILSNASVAEAELKAGESPAESLREIARGSRRAGELVRRMLSFSREQEPERRPLDIGEVANEAASLVRPTLGPHTALRVEDESPLPSVLGDSSQMHQVIVNLITNAAQAIGDGPGSIAVCVDSVAITTRNALGVAPGAFVRLQVRDDGPGIPESVLPRIFDPFFTTQQAGRGTGLGLAAAQAIVRAHDGVLTVSTAVGEGSTFTLHLPLESPAGREPTVHWPRPTVVGPEPAANGLRVLFVDDEPALTHLASRALPLRGCAPTVLNDPRRALTLLERAPRAFDAVITDLAMPTLDGLEFVERARGLRPDIPVVLTSGFLSAEAQAEVERLGIDAVVLKPCSMDALVTAALEARDARISTG